MMKVLPVLQAFQHLGQGDLDAAQQATDFQNKQTMQPVANQMQLADLRRTQAQANLTDQQAQNYQADRQVGLENQAVEGLGSAARGLAYEPDLAQDIIPQLVARIPGLHMNPDAALQRKAAGMFPSMTPDQALQAYKAMQQKMLQHLSK